MSKRVTKGAIFSIGHSTHPIGEFVALLKQHDVDTLVDIRTIPRSRHNPQFGQEALIMELDAAGINYQYMKDLGGLRHTRKDSPNAGWKNASFRGYADYMQTDEFGQALEKLIDLSRKHRLAIMCAEGLPWRCHRSLMADALATRGIKVLHIMPQGKTAPHKLTSFAEVQGVRITYPPETGSLFV